MLAVEHRTRLTVQPLVVPDRDGYETLVVIAKGAWSIARGACVPADEPAELVASDTFAGKPGESSVVLECDFALHKPATDIVVIGHAWAPKAGAREMDIGLNVGSIEHRARVRGDRRFGMALGFARVSDPEPFERIPLAWERAFGGIQPLEKGEGAEGREPRNPIGAGYVKKVRASHIEGLALPNIEDVKQRLEKPGQTPPPVGFGFVGRHWEPRGTLAGTYDAAWERDRMPLLPRDFDARWWNGAPAALQATPHLRGGERVQATGLSRTGALQFRLPDPRVTMNVRFEDEEVALEPKLDTVVIEPDAARVSLVWRAHVRVHGRVRALRAVNVGAEERA